MQSDNKPYNTFIDGYNEKFKEYANKVAETFFERTAPEREWVAQNSNGLLQMKFRQLNQLALDDSKNKYDKLRLTGTILSDVFGEIAQTDNRALKASGYTIANSFFDAARETQDSELLETALNISRKANG